jgi:FKBP-type peptidyl-prolyl cis-trans isomerase FkpA
MSTVTAVPIAPVKRAYLYWLAAGIVAALIAAVALARQGDDFLTRNARAKGVVTTPSGLEYKVLSLGRGGSHPTDTDVALIMYEGKLLNGTTFDKSQQPTPMPVVAADQTTGRQGVVPGFSEALKTMTKGEKARFWIKPSLGYGADAKGPIPANSTLVFDVELLDFLSQAQVQALQQQQMLQQQMMGQMGGAPGGASGAASAGGAPPR